MWKLLNRLSKIQFRLSSVAFIGSYALFTLVCYNHIFWGKIFAATSLTSFSDFLFLVTYFLLLFSIFFLLFALFFFKYTLKFLAIVLLLIHAVSVYFMEAYGVPLDKGMVANIFATDINEATNLFNFKLLLFVLLLGVLPSWLIWKTTIVYRGYVREIWCRILIAILFFGVSLSLVALQYREVATFIRTTQGIFDYLLPTNYLDALVKILRQSRYKAEPVIRISDDFKVEQGNTLVILIVGETARKHNFSLYGYERETNPLLKQDNVIALHHPISCGTSTRISLPCLFSHLGREAYTANSKKYEFLPSALARSGVDVLYKDNNFGGCKETCENTQAISTVDEKSPEFCATGECVDGILLQGLAEHIAATQGNRLIVLHQNGSHGPRYNRRYPEAFEKFKPVCDRSDVKLCSQEELINAYDNTILYLDHLMHKTIAIAKDSKVPAVVIYASDHGESLGENGIYLHGFPYALAPKEQKEIPFIVWMSPTFQADRGIDNQCLNRKTSYSHDNIFHSVLGLFKVQSKLYNPDLDIFAECKTMRKSASD